MSKVDFATLPIQETTLGSVAGLLPWETELSDLGRVDPDFNGADVLVIDGDLDVGEHDIDLDCLFDDLDRVLPFLVLVRGSLRARNVLNSDIDGGTHLFVLGDLIADILLTVDQETFVGGALRLRRGWWGVGQAGRLMVRDVITAPALIADRYRIDDERFRLRHGVTTTAFLCSTVTDYLPRAHAACVVAEEHFFDGADADVPDQVAEWVDIIDVIETVADGGDPFAEVITDPSVDLFVPDPDLIGLSAPQMLRRFADEVSPEALAAVLLHPVVLQECETYDDDLFDEDHCYSVRTATDDWPARVTIVRTVSDPQHKHRFHHFEARETDSGAVYIELLTQQALGAEYEVTPVAPEDRDHYAEALSCFRRLRAFLDR